MSVLKRATSVALLVAVMCAVTAGSAAATTMMLEPAGEVTLSSSGAVTYTGEGIEVACNLQISAELESVIANIEREGSTLGQITGETFEECSGGTFVAILRLPWTLRIVRILGSIPSNFTGILYLVANDTISFRIFGVTCLYIGATGMLYGFTGNPPRGTTIRNLGTSYTKVSGGFPCPATIIRSGTFNVSSTQTASFR